MPRHRTLPIAMQQTHSPVDELKIPITVCPAPIIATSKSWRLLIIVVVVSPVTRLLAVSCLDATLRLPAHEHDEISVFARLDASALIRDDERGARQHHFGEPLNHIGRNDDPIESSLGAGDIGREGLGAAVLTYVLLSLRRWLGVSFGLVHGHDAPAHLGIGVVVKGGENVAADRLVGVAD